MDSLQELLAEMKKSMKLELYSASYGITVDEIDVEIRCQLTKKIAMNPARTK